MLRLFERGHREERWLTVDLRKLGLFQQQDLDVQVKDPETGKQFLISYFGGHFGGSCDGILKGVPEAPKTAHLWECKTASDKYSKQLQKLGVQKAKPEHYAQMQIYMYGLGLKRAYYMSVNKNTDDIYCERIEYDKRFALSILDKAEAIVFADSLPKRISEDPSFWKCKFCDHKNICHGIEKIAPEVNCRTCAHSTAAEDGTWRCDVHDGPLSLHKQKAGCEDHVYMPFLLEAIFGKAIWSADDGAASLIVEYKNGVRNGYCGEPSTNIKRSFSC
jgi:hypothetical protein